MAPISVTFDTENDAQTRRAASHSTLQVEREAHAEKMRCLAAAVEQIEQQAKMAKVGLRGLAGNCSPEEWVLQLAEQKLAIEAEMGRREKARGAVLEQVAALQLS